MPAPTYVSSGEGGGNSTTTPKTIAAGTRAVGDLVVVAVYQPNDGATSVYAVTDNLGNAYTRIETVDGVTSRRIEVWAAILTTGGSCTVSIARSVSAVSFSAAALWASPPHGDSIALDAEGESVNTTAVNHPCAPLGSIDTAANVVVVAAALTDAASGAVTDPTNFTLAQTAQNQRAFLWYRTSDAALADERGTWNSGNNVNSLGYVVSYKTVVGLHQASRRRRRRANSPALCGSAA